ncbi:MAG: ferrous iron transport protein A [Burkholderiales bacterium]|nr:ferrous iron transport protein A [Burkholderiales bacterium]
MSSHLHSARTGVHYRITGIDDDPAVPDRTRQLQELGFLRGEQVVLLRRTQPGNDPMVVRIGLSTFALRRAEAARIRIEADPAHGHR